MWIGNDVIAEYYKYKLCSLYCVLVTVKKIAARDNETLTDKRTEAHTQSYQHRNQLCGCGMWWELR